MTQRGTDVAKATGRHRETQEKMFSKHPPKNMRWDDAVSMFVNLGYTIEGKGGSLFAFWKKGRHLTKHRPHPSPYISVPAIKDMRRFMEENGDTPW